MDLAGILRRLLLSLLLAYWAVFLVYTLGALARGGVDGVVSYYVHLLTEGVLRSWSPREFITTNCVLLAVTCALFAWDHRASAKHEREALN